jgi:ferric-dicitrate binding protein FerR (iron transport regulator)
MNGRDARPADSIKVTVERLASALVDGTCTTAEQTELESLLLAHAEARDSFRKCMHTESILAWKFSEPGRDASRARNLGADPETSVVPTGRPSALVGRAAAALVAIAATAAAVAVLAGRPPSQRPVPEAAAPPIVAKVIAAADAIWADGRQVAVGAGFAPGPIRLVSGQAQITFASGAIVTLHAPAEIEVISAERVFLRHGRITPFVPPEAHGFTVVSPSGEVVDLGTEFTVGVDAAGRTDVFVIDGEVDVTSGHDRPQGDEPLRMTQGYGSRLALSDADPVTTQRPIVIDHFDGANAALRRIEIDSDFPSRVANGLLELPIAAPAGRRHSITRTVLDHDFSSLAGRRSTISYKVTLPSAGTSTGQRWLALVMDAGTGPPPKGWEPAAAAVLVSPDWQVGVRVDAEPVCQAYVFSRGEDAVGPYQVVISIDDTSATHAACGSATFSLMVNGNELIRDTPFRLPARPRLSLQAFAEPYSGCNGVAVVDDLSVSVAAEPPAPAP